MSKQPRHVRDNLERLKATGFLLPGTQDARQLWIMVRQDPSNEPGCFFVTHGRNFNKFHERPGFTVIAHSFDKSALQAAARQATLSCGPQFQPKFSAHKIGTVEKWTPDAGPSAPTLEDDQSLDPSTMLPEPGENE